MVLTRKGLKAMTQVKHKRKKHEAKKHQSYSKVVKNEPFDALKCFTQIFIIVAVIFEIIIGAVKSLPWTYATAFGFLAIFVSLFGYELKFLRIGLGICMASSIGSAITSIYGIYWWWEYLSSEMFEGTIILIITTCLGAAGLVVIMVSTYLKKNVKANALVGVFLYAVSILGYAIGWKYYDLTFLNIPGLLALFMLAFLIDKMANKNNK